MAGQPGPSGPKFEPLLGNFGGGEHTLDIPAAGLPPLPPSRRSGRITVVVPPKTAGEEGEAAGRKGSREAGRPEEVGGGVGGWECTGVGPEAMEG